jgi:hypothetical protein
MSEMGLEEEDFASDKLRIWPENWQAVELFAQVRTQWRVGPGGPYGLDYNVVDRRLDRLGLDERARAAIEADIQIMEFAALEELNR